jgi:glycerate kinase
MKIVIAPDSFKESLSAPEVARAIAAGVHHAAPEAHLISIPMADGGEGTVEAVLAATQGEKRMTPAHDALGRPLHAAWAWLADQTAVIEMATTGAVELRRPAERDAMRASSFGGCEVIKAALSQGAKRIVLGLGGSATNDGGAGMLQALGLRLLAAQGHDLAPGGGALGQLVSVEASKLDPRLTQLEVIIASDVDNPLCGPQGASATFGPQKGASPEQVLELDHALTHFAMCCAQLLGTDAQNAKGAGAAGGLGFAALTFMKASFKPGVQVVAEIGGLAKALQGASLAFTGEGRMDAQTLHGKTPMGVAQIAKGLGVPVFALAGSLGDGYKDLYHHGIHAAFSLTNGPMSLEQACQHTAQLLKDRAEDITRVWLAARHNVI